MSDKPKRLRIIDLNELENLKTHDPYSPVNKVIQNLITSLSSPDPTKEIIREVMNDGRLILSNSPRSESYINNLIKD